MSYERVWIDTQAVDVIHAEQLEEHGGQAGVRDRGLLESALNRPRNLWAYSSPKPDIAALAASIAFGIAKNHPFLDGNKRTAWVLCRTMLLLNGCNVIATQDEKYKAVIALASGEMTEEAFAEWLRGHVTDRV